MAVDINVAAQIITNIALMLGGIVIIGGVVYVVARFYLIWKRNDTTCIILEEDGFGSTSMVRDWAGVYVDNKTQNKRFFLKNNNVGLNPDKIPYIRNTKGKKYVFLRKVGLKNFNYINLDQLFTENPKIMVGEEDVNWAINAYERQKKVFGTTLLQQLLPYIGITIMGVFILGMLVVLFQKVEVLAEVAEAFKEAAQAFAQAKSGTTVVPGAG